MGQYCNVYKMSSRVQKAESKNCKNVKIFDFIAISFFSSYHCFLVHIYAIYILSLSPPSPDSVCQLKCMRLQMIFICAFSLRFVGMEHKHMSFTPFFGWKIWIHSMCNLNGKSVYHINAKKRHRVNVTIKEYIRMCICIHRTQIYTHAHIHPIQQHKNATARTFPVYVEWQSSNNNNNII